MNAFRERFRDVHSDQYNFTKLQAARQAKKERPMEYTVRCKGLAQRVMSNVNDPVAQRIHGEDADRMCLASFVTGISGVVDRQVHYANPMSLHEALNLALAVDEAEKQVRRNETFYTRSDEFASHLSHQARRVAGETALNAQLTHMRGVRRLKRLVALGQELRLAALLGATNVKA